MQGARRAELPHRPFGAFCPPITAAPASSSSFLSEPVREQRHNVLAGEAGLRAASHASGARHARGGRRELRRQQELWCEQEPRLGQMAHLSIECAWAAQKAASSRHRAAARISAARPVPPSLLIAN